MPDWSWWLIVAVIFALGELAIFTGFILGPLAVAAAATAGVAALGGSIEVQLAVFIVASTVMITALRPIAKRHMQSPPEILTNTAALVGKNARVLEAMTPDSPGMVRLENENWTALPAPGVGRIEAETHVIVKRIDGATAIVEPQKPMGEADS
ncbi:MAG: NfeD family protein [Actinobacteria bacterium]|nr:NfeD family protein [Actinomycetota bacterium]